MEKCDTLVMLTYRWTRDELVLHKFVTITNRSREPWNRLLSVRLGIRRRFSAHFLPEASR